jgi:hypothetical protein
VSSVRTRVLRSSLLATLVLGVALCVAPTSVAASGASSPMRLVRSFLPGQGGFGKHATAAALACPAPGRCVAAGQYERGPATPTYVVIWTLGPPGWSAPLLLPGLAAVTTSDTIVVRGLSCGAVGDCALVGTFADVDARSHAFVDTESRGVWRVAHEVVGASRLGGVAHLFSVSCPAAGRCVAGGDAGDRRPIAVVLRGASWSSPAALRTVPVGEPATVEAVACAAAGRCAAGGALGPPGHAEPFVDELAGATWRGARALPDAGAANPFGRGVVTALSCVAPGVCAAVGQVATGAARLDAFVDLSVGGRWRPLRLAPGAAALNAGGFGSLVAVDCARRGDCTAVGSVTLASGDGRAIAISSVSGTWRTVALLRGVAATTPGSSSLSGLSCSGPGDCTAVGGAVGIAGRALPVAAAERRGAWTPAAFVGGYASRAVGESADVIGVSCAAPTRCVALGTNGHRGTDERVIVLVAAPADARSTALAPATSRGRGGT